MRFERLCLKFPGDEFWIRFHERLTVLSGIGALERRALTESMLSALTGGPESSEMTYIDATGRRVTVASDDGVVVRTYDDGSPAVDLLGLLDHDRVGLRSLTVVGPADLGLTADAGPEDSRELIDARTTLAVMTDELQRALAAQQTVDALAHELSVLEEAIHSARENEARRRYAHLLADLERVRAEAAALRSGHAGVESDRRLMAAADDARHLAGEWRAAVAQARDLANAFEGRPRIDRELVDRLAGMPTEAPARLDVLTAALDVAEGAHRVLADRLRDLAASRLPQPSNPLVVDLARVEQDRLWSLNRRVVATAAALEAQSVALGGLRSGGADVGLVDEVELQHDEVVQAEQTVDRRKKTGIIGSGAGVVAGAAGLAAAPLLAPVALAGAAGAAAWALLGPKQRLARAQRKEAQALDRVGANTYLAFHLRRVDAIVARDSRQHYETAVEQHSAALAEWHAAMGDLDPAEAAALEAEVRAYAASLAGLGGTADEIESVRIELDRLQPAVIAARNDILAACAGFGVDDPAAARAVVMERLAQGRTARLQVRLEAVEERELALRTKLDGLLVDLSFGDGELAARVGALEWALARAAERQRARSMARDPAKVEAELAELEDETRRTRRPEWASVTASDANAPDLEQLEQKRDAAASAHRATSGMVPDVERLADRHRALERRVAVLENGSGSDAYADPADVRQYLLARLTAAGHAGPDGDPMPVVLDDALARLSADSIWELLDLLERVAEKVQVVYLTNDAYVAAWARRRAGTGDITLLEPVAEPA